MEMKMFKISSLFISLSIFVLSGCAVSLKMPDDYNGSDFSRIRVQNSIDVLSMSTYEKEGDCYKYIDKVSLGPGFNIMGVKSTANKKIPSMTPPSEKMIGVDALEYKIKANQGVVISYEIVKTTQYNTITRPFIHKFIPEKGHDYDIYIGDTQTINVYDLTDKKYILTGWRKGDETCGR